MVEVINMDDKYILAAIGVIGLILYGCVALYTGHNGTVMTAVISAVVGIIAGTIGFIAAKKL